jgi:hypothetical protein
MMTRGPAILLAPILLAAAGCGVTSTEVVEAEDVLVVEAYLRVDAPFQEVLLYRSLPGENGSLRVDGATVRLISGAADTLPMAPASGTGCIGASPFPEGQAGSCYATGAAPGFVLPGMTYTLSVTALDGRRLEGTTTVPGSFRIVRPAADPCSVPEGAAELVWTPAERAWSYQAAARFTGLASGLEQRGVENPPDTLELVGLAIGADTTIAFPEEFGVFDRFSLPRDLAVALQQGLPDGASADIVVAAGDRNFVNWVRGGNFNPSGQVRIPSVTGDGTGVVASLVVRRRTILTDTSIPVCE